MVKKSDEWRKGWTSGLGTSGEDNKLCFIGKDEFFIHLIEEVKVDQ